MKRQQQKASKELRAQGHSVQEIAEMLAVSKGSVSRWVADVAFDPTRVLTRQAMGRALAGQTKRKTAKEARRRLRDEGVAAAHRAPLHVMGCMLYWAEGAKSRNVFHFCNSDRAMVELMMRFLVEEMRVVREQVKFQIFCYDDIHSLAEIESYWLAATGVSADNMRKTVLNRYPEKSLKVRTSLLPYGTCHLFVYDQRIVQHIYGALEVYAGMVLDPGS